MKLVLTSTIVVCLNAASFAAPTAELISVTKISDRAPHSAFTDLIYWKDQFVCAFREGRGEARLRPDTTFNGMSRSAAHVLRTVGQSWSAAIRRDVDQSTAMRMRSARTAGRLYETIRMRMRLA